MELSIPDDQYQRLSDRAQAAGYASVPALIEALSSTPTEDPRGPLTATQLDESLAELEAADAQIDAGEDVEAEAAFQQIASKHGLKLNR
ncbi:MAG: hypothetical protein AAGJ46_13490 [Planctomycetota bacterium]